MAPQPPPEDEKEEEPIEEEPLLRVGATLGLILSIGKRIILFALWITFTYFLMFYAPHERTPSLVSIRNDSEANTFKISRNIDRPHIRVTLYGPFELHDKIRRTFTERDIDDESPSLAVVVQIATEGENAGKPVSDVWKVELQDPSKFDSAQSATTHYDFIVNENADRSQNSLQFAFNSNVDKDFCIELAYNEKPVDLLWGPIAAIILIVWLFFILLFDVVHRTLALIIINTMALGLLSFMNERPTLEEMVSFIDFQVPMMIFSMTLIIAMFNETSILDYLAVRGYELAKGHVWPLLNTLMLIAFLLSIVVSNIPIMMLMVPIVLRVCDVMQLTPVPLLICVIIFSNLGSALTPFAEPLEVIVTSNHAHPFNQSAYIFYLKHIMPAVLLALLQSYIHLRLLFFNSEKMRLPEGGEVEHLRRMIRLWKHTAKSISPYSKGEHALQDSLMGKVNRLRRRLKRIGRMPKPTENLDEVVQMWKGKYPLRNKPLLIMCSLVLLCVFLLYTVHIFGFLHPLTFGWGSLLGLLLLLIITDKNEELEHILHHIDWSTLLFFATLFVFAQCLNTLGLYEFVCQTIKKAILSVDKKQYLFVAITTIIWFSAILSALTGTIPTANLFIHTANHLSMDAELSLPLEPLLWALILGICFGSNGTLIGYFANVICAGTCEKHGTRFSFFEYLKIGFPVMLGNVLVGWGYLYVAHCVFSWH